MVFISYVMTFSADNIFGYDDVIASNNADTSDASSDIFRGYNDVGDVVSHAFLLCFKKQKYLSFALYCARFALSLQHIGFGSA